MRKLIRNAAAASLCVLGFIAATAAPAQAVTRQQVVINGFQVDRYVWTDSVGRPRTVALKKQGSGNPGNGGYAVQMTYQYIYNGVRKTMTVNPSEPGEGFGYFVSHERFRKFSDGDSATIAGKIFGVDDSPLGRGFAVATRIVPTSTNRGAIEFTQTYRRYGTIAAGGINPDTGEDNPPLGTNAALFKRYDLVVKITWYFQDGVDYPRIVTRVDMSSAPGADHVSFDLRGPYGSMDFEAGVKPINQVLWADRYQFRTTAAPLTRNATWLWNVPNAGARFTALTAGQFEMGLLEPARFQDSYMRDGYSEGRSQTSATYNGGNGCPFQDQKIPCDYEWPYQSSQYQLPYDNPNGTTTSEKIAWGSTAYYGTSLPAVFDGTTSTPFVGYPNSKALKYSVCVVLGLYIKGGLTRTVAGAGGTYSCATVP